MKNRGLAFKLMVFILASSACIFSAAFSYNYYSSKKTVIRDVEENARNLARSTVYRIESVLQGVEKVPLNMASVIGRYPYGVVDIFHLVQSAVANNPEVYGSIIAYEPYNYEPDTEYFAPYCYRGSNGSIKSEVLGGEDYRYFVMDWYQIPKLLKEVVWSEPYYDEGGGNIVMATVSVPFYKEADGEKDFQGIVTADISLSWLTEILSSVTIYRTGYAFVITRNGVFVTYPDNGFIMRKSIFSIAEENADRNLRDIGRDMIAGREDFIPLVDFASGKKSWMYYAPLPSNGWSVGVIFPEDELYADVWDLGKEVVIIGLIGFLFLFFTVAMISQTITRPLRFLDATTHEIAKGNLDIELPEPRSNDEIGRLTRSFKEMKSALKEYIANLAETTASKERMESELKIARTIQMSFLPKRFPSLPETEVVEVFATLEPAREIGGDLYDFFFLDRDHLFFVVGDVSGKGIPAALFMAVSKTLLKGVTELGMEPSEVLERVNAELCIDNESMMFVTVFCAVLDLRTGELRYSNGGHVPPVLLREGGEPVWVEIPPGVFLGTFDDARYKTGTLSLIPGDTILVYTDGVSEAMDARRELYTGARLMTALRSVPDGSPETVVREVLESVRDYSSGEPQADDITILAVRFKAFKT
ncbi:SpoIIE family protein phosphatase [Syntrophobacter fumaroxidans]|uniref:Serine phosphatase n=1 Tax=Syntrophobacter fumaroxidans (strain DSM 10017 / MPOB) TaxID=335543 RepID=A0LKD4_SYNFM|nr:SpoIIE family protein phosphatase [Syntrophobacter fumaroxidans]ABK17886.1 serine phosphatase [Syntrophobacter fumaroxidans MPOB]